MSLITSIRRQGFSGAEEFVSKLRQSRILQATLFSSATAILLVSVFVFLFSILGITTALLVIVFILDRVFGIKPTGTHFSHAF